jgi:NADH-quinone oxidoreductase subunit A
MLELYLPMFLMFAIVAVISSVMFLGGQFIGPKNPTPEKMMPFECGNDTDGARGTKMSVKFYLTAILFVVFDIEVVFMYPWAALFKSLGWVGFASMFGFIIALLVALAYCWKKGALEWES